MASHESDKEYLIRIALEDAETIGIRAASRKHGIKRTTLRDRRAGATEIHKAHEKCQKLSFKQEDDIVQWILDREDMNSPVTKQEVHAFAACVAARADPDEHLGKHWVERFLSRHEDIKMKPSRLIEAARKSAITKEGLEDYYSGLDRLIKRKNASSDRILNCDETGVQEGETYAGKVLGTVLTTFAELLKSDSTLWISILETISALSRRLTPLVIFTGNNLQGQWFPEVFPDWKYAYSPSGWSNNELFLSWFRDIFLPETQPADPTLWRILVLDRHKTHLTPDFMLEAWNHKVWPSWLPSHSSHITQPLDVALFSPLKTFYHEETRDWVSYETTSPIQKQRFLTAYKKASERAFTQENIQAGFRASGIWPTTSEPALAKWVPPKRSHVAISPPRTPKKSSSAKIYPWDTPHSSLDIRKQLDYAIDCGITVPRVARTSLRNSGKEIDILRIENTNMKLQLAYHRARECAHKRTGRKAVQLDPNHAFPDIVRIKKARDEAEKQAAMSEKASIRKSTKKQRKNEPLAENSIFSQFFK